MPTDSIQFGELAELHRRAAARIESLHGDGIANAYLYGAPGTQGATNGLNHLHAFFLLLDRPEVYNLPAAPSRGASRLLPSLLAGLATAMALTGLAFILLAVTM